MRISVARALACAVFPLIPFGPALAVDQDIQLSATVESSCTLSGSAAPSALVATIPVTNGVVSTTPIAFAIPVACNVPAALYIGSINGGLRGGNALQGTSNRIDYVASVSSAFYIPFSLDTAAAQGQQWTESYAPSGAPNGSINVTVTPKQPSLPLRNGTYADTLRVIIAPSQ